MVNKAGYQGFVKLTIWGNSPEKVINMAVARGIPVWKVKDTGNGQWTLFTKVEGVRPLFRLARKNGCSLKIVQKKGPVFWWGSIKRRKSLAIGCLIFCLGLHGLSQIIWFVEVNCPNPLLEQKTHEIMGEKGLTRFSLRSAVNLDEAREYLTKNLPEAAWIGVELNGCRLQVEVVEKLSQDDPVLFGNGDIIAREEGTIEELLVLQGVPMVKVGDRVEKGQLLIAGIKHSSGLANGFERVQAKGVIRAKVTRRIPAMCPLKEEVLQDTGKKSTWYQLKFKEKEIRLNGVPEPPYPLYRVVKSVKTIWHSHNHNENIQLITLVYKEQEKSIIKRTPQEAIEESIRRAEEALSKIVPEDCRILELKALPAETASAGAVQIYLLAETLEDIGSLKVDEVNDK